jgi:hypothetical protein
LGCLVSKSSLEGGEEGEERERGTCEIGGAQHHQPKKNKNAPPPKLTPRAQQPTTNKRTPPPPSAAYPPLKPDFQQSDLEVTLNYHAQELAFFGVDLLDLINRKGKQLVISEWGIGGGTPEGKKIAPDLEYVAANPFFGLWYPYAYDKDPWTNPEYNAYRRKVHKATAEWLKSRGGPRLRVDGLYTWNAGSWDSLGVNVNSGGSWIDPQIQSMVRAHNAYVNSD